ncbi:MAG: hypothetical protein Q7U53_15530 [Anaerolineaceae bacterium]|nr:hypothetical protein [Anaerolineaceae bacterium]
MKKNIKSKNKLKIKYNNSAVISPLDEHMGLDIARSLGRRGIKVFGFDPDPKAVARVSNYCELVVCPDLRYSEKEFIQFLIEWGKTQSNKSVLYPVSDETVFLCSREREKIKPYFEFVVPDHGMLEKLSSKQGLDSAAIEFNIPAPITVIPSDVHEVEMIVTSLTFPVILKPTVSSYWHTSEIQSLFRENALSGRVKVVVCNNGKELLQNYNRIAGFDMRMIIQEMIPGPDENLAYISFYLNRHSIPLAIFAGKKIRTLPIGFGSASYVRSFQDSELEQVALQLLSRSKYQGFGGLEFKKDIRDGKYKLVEFNTRFGMWDGLAVRCGVDTPYISYQDILGKAIEPQLTYKSNIIWVDWQKDVRAFWMYHKQKNHTFFQWIKSLQGEKMWAIYSFEDWRPGVEFTFRLFLLFLTKITKILFSPRKNR